MGGNSESGMLLVFVCVRAAGVPCCVEELCWRFVMVVGAPIGVLDLPRAEADLPLGAWALDPPPIGSATTAVAAGVALVLG